MVKYFYFSFKIYEMTDIEKYENILNKHLGVDKKEVINKILEETFGLESSTMLQDASVEVKPLTTSVMDNLLIYTDGACVGNPGPGGSAMVVIKGKDIIHKFVHNQPKTTNNRMELLAIFEGLQWLKTNSFGSAVLRSDSLYCLNPLTKGWIYKWEKDNYKNKQNSDLWKKIFPLYEELKDNIELEWVKGHSGERYNTLVDYLAEKAAREI